MLFITYRDITGAMKLRQSVYIIICNTVSTFHTNIGIKVHVYVFKVPHQDLLLLAGIAPQPVEG
jgi:hypothetical protein